MSHYVSQFHKRGACKGVIGAKILKVRFLHTKNLSLSHKCKNLAYLMIYLFKPVIYFCVTQEVDSSDDVVSKSKTVTE